MKNNPVHFPFKAGFELVRIIPYPIYTDIDLCADRFTRF